jgi:hypothetical protein
MKRVGSLIGIVAIVLLNQSAWGIVGRHDVAASQYTLWQLNHSLLLWGKCCQH